MKRTKIAALIAAIIVLTTTFVAPSVAWMMDKTEAVVNTFTYGDITIKLTETDTGLDGDDDPKTNLYEMIVGQTIEKDPKVTVLKGSEKSWLMVRLEKQNEFDKYLEYTIADKDGKAVEGVYFRIVEKAEDDVVFGVIKDDTVNLRAEITKESLRDMVDLPKLNVTAYAVQYEKIDTAINAWEIINPADVEIVIE